MKIELEKLENESINLEKQQKQLISSKTTNANNLIEEKQDEIIESLKNKINEQIKNKKMEKNSKIPYQEIVLEKDNKTNLYCDKCKINCHKGCDCMFLLFWNPVFACSLIQNGKCNYCKCDKDKHQRSKNLYINKNKEKH